MGVGLARESVFVDQHEASFAKFIQEGKSGNFVCHYPTPADAIMFFSWLFCQMYLFSQNGVGTQKIHEHLTLAERNRFPK